MDVLLQAFRDAFTLLLALDPALLSIIVLTLRVSGGALALAVLIGLPFGTLLGLNERIPAAGLVQPLLYTGMWLPPVVVGLFVYLFLSNQGILGDWRWLFTPTAMILAQTLI